MSDGLARRAIEAPHVHDTTCYFLTQRDPWTRAAEAQNDADRMRTTAIGKVGRDIRPITPRHLSQLRPKGSWLLVVLLCNGDDMAPLVSWLLADRSRADRVRFYHHARTPPGPLLKPWADADLLMPRIDAFYDQRSLSARLGLDIVQRIVDDFGPSARRPPL